MSQENLLLGSHTNCSAMGLEIMRLHISDVDNSIKIYVLYNLNSESPGADLPTSLEAD